MLNRIKYTLFFIGWMVLITLLSLFSISIEESTFQLIPYKDKVVHFVFYAVAALLGCLFLKERSQSKIPLAKAMVKIFISMLLYGILIEVIQWKFTSWRSGEIADVLANSLGAFTGVAAIKFLYSGDWQLKWRN